MYRKKQRGGGYFYTLVILIFRWTIRRVVKKVQGVNKYPDKERTRRGQGEIVERFSISVYDFKMFYKLFGYPSGLFLTHENQKMG
jgi:hypothetical protein